MPKTSSLYISNPLGIIKDLQLVNFRAMHLNPYPRQNSFQDKSSRQGFPYLGDEGKSPSLTKICPSRLLPPQIDCPL